MINSDNLKDLMGLEEHESMMEEELAVRGLSWVVKRLDLIVQPLPRPHPHPTELGIKVRFCRSLGAQRE